MTLTLTRTGALAGHRKLIAGIFAALLGLITWSTALAHARYDHSTPNKGEVVAASPARLDIFTVQDMKKDSANTEIQVADASGARVDTADTTIDDANRRHFSVGLKSALPVGRYVVSFKNVSDEDGEADHGEFAFYVGTGPTAAQKTQDTALQITTMADDTKSSSNTGRNIAIIAGAVVIVLVLAGGAFVAMRRRRA